MSIIDIEAIRAEVLRKHNLALNRDDPIFATVILHEMVLGAFLERAEAAASELEKRGAQLMLQEVEVVKKTAEGMIAGAAKFIAAEVQSVMAQARRDLHDEVIKALDRRESLQLNARQAAAKESGTELKIALYVALPTLAMLALALIIAVK